MPTRKLLAVVLLAVWAGTLGWHARRLYLRPRAEELARAARTLPPGVAYYAVLRGDRPAGWVRSEIDTLPDGGFRVEDRLEMELAALGLPGTATVTAGSELGPALSLRRFEVEARGVLGGIGATGSVEGDSVLLLRVEQGGTEIRRRVPLEGPLLLSTTVPLRLAVEERLRPGDRIRLRIFDPATLASRTEEIEILEERVTTYPDSADRGPDGGWRAARRDTVRAWRVRGVPGLPGGPGVESWIDEDGRFLRAELPAGFRLERTAFELAYFRWRGER